MIKKQLQQAIFCKIARFYIKKLEDEEFNKHPLFYKHDNGKSERASSVISGDHGGIRVFGSALKVTESTSGKSVILVDFEITCAALFKEKLLCKGSLQSLSKKTDKSPDMFGPVTVFIKNQDGTIKTTNQSFTISGWINKQSSVPFASCSISFKSLVEVVALDDAGNPFFDPAEQTPIDKLAALMRSENSETMPAASQKAKKTSKDDFLSIPNVDHAGKAYAW